MLNILTLIQQNFIGKLTELLTVVFSVYIVGFGPL